MDRTQRETAEYLTSMIRTLQQMAEADRLDVLAYLLSLALEQAERDKATRNPPRKC